MHFAICAPPISSNQKAFGRSARWSLPSARNCGAKRQWPRERSCVASNYPSCEFERLSEDASVQMKYRVPFAQALFAANSYDEAIAAIDAVLSDRTNDTRALMFKARALVARNRIADAHGSIERILDHRARS